MAIGENLTKNGIKFISSVQLQNAKVVFNEDGTSTIVTVEQTPGIGEVTSETHKKLDEIIVNEGEEGN